MGNNWDHDLARMLQQKKAKEEAEKQEKERLDEQRRKAEKIAEYTRRLQEYRKKYKCQVKECDVVSDPKRLYWDSDIGNYYCDWNTPVGLKKCLHCGKWACLERGHYGEKTGYCQDCGNFYGRKQRLPHILTEKEKRDRVGCAILAIVVVGILTIFISALTLSPGFRESMQVVGGCLFFLIVIGLIMGISGM